MDSNYIMDGVPSPLEARDFLFQTGHRDHHIFYVPGTGSRFPYEEGTKAEERT
jgi:hypothetical protein